MTEIKTNGRFDSLTNLDISTHYRHIEMYLFPSAFLSALAYWITAQNPNIAIINTMPALEAFEKHIRPLFENPALPEKFTYDRLAEAVTDDVFDAIPEIHELNNLKPDFIGLGALARNVFYMILRQHITQS